MINLGRLQQAIDAKKLDIKKKIDADALVASGVVRRVRSGVRLLANGEFNAKITIEVVGASKAAIELVEKVGGKVVILADADTANNSSKTVQATEKAGSVAADNGTSDESNE